MYQWTDEERRVWLTKVRELIASRFDVSELRSLCAELGIDYDDVPGTSKADKTRELPPYCERRDKLNELIQKCRELRPPKVDWPDSPPKSEEPPEPPDKRRKPKEPPEPPGERPKPEKPKHFPLGYLFVIVGVVILGLAVLGYYIVYKAPTVVDTMDSLSGWFPFRDPRSAITTSLVSGMPGFGKAIQLDFDLQPNALRRDDSTYVGIGKVITPTLLSGTQRMRFYYKAASLNTIELKLFYDPDGKDEAFSFVRRESHSKDDWVKLEEPYSAFTPRGRTLIPENVRRLEIAVSHQLGGTPGPGRVVIDQIEALK